MSTMVAEPWAQRLWAPYSFAGGEAGAAAGPSSGGADLSGSRAGEEP